MTEEEKPVPNLHDLFIETSLTDELRENDCIYKGFLHPCPQCNFYDFVRGGCEELSCFILDDLKEKENG
jgi:hypothetical protein